MAHDETGYAVDVIPETAMYACDVFATYREAVEYVKQVAESWEDAGFTVDHGWASPDNMYAVKGSGGQYAGVTRDDS